MEAQWTEPDQPNGILERYVLYVSEQQGEAGREVYNTTDLFRDYVITDLTAGTLYYVSVAVSIIFYVNVVCFRKKSSGIGEKPILNKIFVVDIYERFFV